MRNAHLLALLLASDALNNPEYPHVGSDRHNRDLTNLANQLDAFPFAPPQFTTVDRDALADVPVGALIDNADTGTLQRYDGAAWADVGAAGGGLAMDDYRVTGDPSGGGGTLVINDVTLTAFALPPDQTAASAASRRDIR